MRLDKKLIIAIVGIVTLIWAINIYYYNSKSINRPLFFRHLIETNLNHIITLNYIENINNEDKIHYVVLPELGDERIYINDSNISYSDRHYNYCSLNLNLANAYCTYNEKLEKYIPNIEGGKLVTKIVYGTLSGREYTEDIGEIYIKKYTEYKEHKFIVESGVSSVESNSESVAQISRTYFNSTEGVKFTGYNSYFKNQLNDIFNVELNGESIFNNSKPIKVDALDNALMISLKENDNENFTDFHYINIDLYFENNKGEKDVHELVISPKSSILNRHEFSREDIDNLIKIRGGR